MCKGSDSAEAALANLLAKCTKSTNGHGSRPITTPTPTPMLTSMPRRTSRTLNRSSSSSISTNNCQQAGSAARGVSEEPKKQAANRQNMHQEHKQKQKQLPLQHNQRQQQGHQIVQMVMEQEMVEGMPRDSAKEHEHKQQAQSQCQSQSKRQSKSQCQTQTQTQSRPSKCRSKQQQQQHLLRRDQGQRRRNCNNVAGVQRQWRKHVLWLLPLLLVMLLPGTAAGAMTPSARIARSPAVAAAAASSLLIASAKGSARELLYADLGGGSSGGSTGAGSSSSAGLGGGGGGAAGIECPSFDDSSACPCYKFEDGLFLECPGTTALSLRSTLERISAPIHSLSIYDFDRSVTSLSQDVFQPGVHIRHLQFSHSHLEALKDNSLRNVRSSLESLSIVNGKLTQMHASVGDATAQPGATAMAAPSLAPDPSEACSQLPEKCMAPMRTRVEKIAPHSPCAHSAGLRVPLSSVKIHICGLSPAVKRDDIVEIFGQFGPLRKVEFPTNQHPNNPMGRGYAFVHYVCPTDCALAIRHMHQGTIAGQKIAVTSFQLGHNERARTIRILQSQPRHEESLSERSRSPRHCRQLESRSPRGCPPSEFRSPRRCRRSGSRSPRGCLPSEFRSPRRCRRSGSRSPRRRLRSCSRSPGRWPRSSSRSPMRGPDISPSCRRGPRTPPNPVYESPVHRQDPRLRKNPMLDDHRPQSSNLRDPRLQESKYHGRAVEGRSRDPRYQQVHARGPCSPHWPVRGPGTPPVPDRQPRFTHKDVPRAPRAPPLVKTSGQSRGRIRNPSPPSHFDGNRSQSRKRTPIRCRNHTDPTDPIPLFSKPSPSSPKGHRTLSKKEAPKPFTLISGASRHTH